jgi:hypothetical protein
MAACGIAPEDNDGNAAKPKPKLEPEPKKPEPKQSTLMTEAQIADWMAAFSVCAADELDDIKTRALATAEKHKDREAYSTFRAAAKRRHDELAGAAKEAGNA